jgi:hypothetical protein
MSGSEELAQAEEEQGGEEYEGAEDDAELAAMQKELEKAEQQKAELDKLNKMQGTVKVKAATFFAGAVPCILLSLSSSAFCSGGGGL